MYASAPGAQAQEAVRSDSLARAEGDSVAMSDTLRTVEVTRDGRIGGLQIDPFWLEAFRYGSKSKLSDFLPGPVTDRIMHPFAVKQRKKERHRKKMNKALRDYDQLRTPNELLLEALRREGIDPETLIPPHRE